MMCKYLQQQTWENVSGEGDKADILMITSTGIMSNDTKPSGAHKQQAQIIIDSKLSLQTSKMLWPNTMKVKLLCMDSLTSMKDPWVVLWRRTAQWYCSASEMSSVSSTPDVTEPNWWTRWQRRATQISLAFEQASLTPPHGCFFNSLLSELSLTLMSRPPGDISGGQQVQSQGSPAAAVYLLTSHCWSNKPKQCGKLHSDIRSLIFIWYPNHTALSALCYTWL